MLHRHLQHCCLQKSAQVDRPGKRTRPPSRASIHRRSSEVMCCGSAETNLAVPGAPIQFPAMNRKLCFLPANPSHRPGLAKLAIRHGR